MKIRGVGVFVIAQLHGLDAMRPLPPARQPIAGVPERRCGVTLEITLRQQRDRDENYSDHDHPDHDQNRPAFVTRCIIARRHHKDYREGFSNRLPHRTRRRLAPLSERDERYGDYRGQAAARRARVQVPPPPAGRARGRDRGSAFELRCCRSLAEARQSCPRRTTFQRFAAKALGRISLV